VQYLTFRAPSVSHDDAEPVPIAERAVARAAR
jgi:hypothetical protein